MRAVLYWMCCCTGSHNSDKIQWNKLKEPLSCTGCVVAQEATIVISTAVCADVYLLRTVDPSGIVLHTVGSRVLQRECHPYNSELL